MSKAIVKLTKSKFKDYNYRIKRIKELKQQREELLCKLTSISSPKMDGVTGNHDSDIPMEDTIIIQKITDIENDIEMHRQLNYSVDVFLDTCDEEISDAIRKIYLQGYSYEKVSGEMYLSDAGLAKRIDKEIVNRYS